MIDQKNQDVVPKSSCNSIKTVRYSVTSSHEKHLNALAHLEPRGE